jgi:hypothetical protein
MTVGVGARMPYSVAPGTAQPEWGESMRTLWPGPFAVVFLGLMVTSPMGSALDLEILDAEVGFDPEALTDRHGIDVRGWFHGDLGTREPSPAYVLTLLDDLDYAEAVLRRGMIRGGRSIGDCVPGDCHTLFRGDMELAAEDAERLGTARIRVAIKPSARGSYGDEYWRELAFYALGRYLQAQGLVPIVERNVAWEPLRGSIWDELSETQRRRLRLFEDEEQGPYLRASVQLWVEGYQPRLGFSATTNRRLNAFAEALRPEGRVPVTEDPLWQGLSDMFLLDFLVGNSDRSREAGSVVLPSGGQRLIQLDNGDTLRRYNRHRDREPLCDTRFASLQLFRAAAVAGLEALDAERLHVLWTGIDGDLLVREGDIDYLLGRVRLALAHIDSVARAHGGLERILFSEAQSP